MLQAKRSCYYKMSQRPELQNDCKLNKHAGCLPERREKDCQLSLIEKEFRANYSLDNTLFEEMRYLADEGYCR